MSTSSISESETGYGTSSLTVFDLRRAPRTSPSSGFFFGVPHRGADLAYWANFATALAKKLTLGFTGNINHVEALKRNSQAFAKISQLFVERAANVQTRTFYKGERTKNQVVRSLLQLG